MKVLHFADLHLRLFKHQKEYLELLKNLLQIIQEQDPDILIFAGDFCHSKTIISPELIDMVTVYLRTLADLKPLHLILGNHDGNLKNESRQDAISPIVAALNHPNVFLHKKSEEVSINEQFSIFFLSPFDEQGYGKPSNTTKVNIAVYHGSLVGGTTDTGFMLPGGEDIGVLDGFDYALLGDLHCHQSLDDAGRFRYCGSTRQQNHGESNDKGVLIWDIQDKQTFDVRHIVVKSIHPYVTVELQQNGDLPEDLQIESQARVRIVSPVGTSLDLLHKAIDVIKSRFSPEAISFVHKGKKQITNNLGGADNAEENLRELSVQEKYIKEYLEPFKLSDEDTTLVLGMNKKYNSMLGVDEEGIERGIHWSLERIEWDNLFNYGEDNFINVKNLNGIVGLLGPNASGKSSAIDGATYTIFNTSFKNSRKSLNIVNQNKDFGEGRATIKVGNKEYNITRNAEKTVKRSKGVQVLEAKTNVNFSYNDGEQINSLNGQDRNQTDKNIRSIFGTLDDFLLTSFSSQGGMNVYINEGSTKRKEILAKFLDLQVFEEKFKLAKDDASSIKANLKRLEAKDYTTEIAKAEIRQEDLVQAVSISELFVPSLRREIEDKKEELIKCKFQLSKYAETQIIDADALNVEKDKITTRTQALDIEIEELSSQITEKQSLLNRIETFLGEFKVEQHEGKITNAEQIQREVNKISTEINMAKAQEKNNEQKTQLLKEVPCGKEYASCKFIRDAYTAADSLPGIKELLQKAEESRKKLQDSIDEEDLEKSKEYLSKYKEILQNRSSLQTDVMRLSSQKTQKETLLRQLTSRLDAIVVELELYEQSVQAQKEMKMLMESIRYLEGEIVSKEKECVVADRTYKQQLNELGSATQEVQTLKECRDEMLQLRKEYSVFEHFLRCMHPSGISYQIIKKKLPIINAEISRVLMNVVDFEVFFVDDDDKLDIYIKYPSYEPRVIEMGSGMEKSLAAMAIRLGLFNVSTLPKPDFMILDEPATELDSESMEGFVRILELLRGTFRVVFLISHLDSLKDAVDMIIPIEKINGYARVQI